MNEPNPETFAAVGVQTPARSLWRAGMPGWVYLDLLREQRHLEDAVRVSPLLLPAREAVWWGCLCVWHTAGAALAERDRQGVTAAMRWVVAPSDAHWRAAGTAAEHCGMTSMGGCVAAAAGYASHESAFITPRCAAAAAFVAAMTHEPLRFEAHYLAFIAIGREVAEGRHHWNAAAATTSSPLAGASA